MIGSLCAGALLGLSAGLSPGPLLALVMAQTLRHGPREGAKAALSPLVTDLPIILVCALVLAAARGQSTVLGAISLAGSAVLLRLGLDSLRARGLRPDPRAAAPRSLLQGVLVNALSPHPYLFWLGVGMPLVYREWARDPVSAAAFLIAFYACLVGSKLGVALLCHRGRRLLAGAAYVWTMRLLGVLLLAFAGLLVRDGLRLLGLLPA
ncbi:LysE family translocator [Desulfovibrio aminophilus]|nr:LysE family translocator [Desulfovibrio aminophilus]MCM0755041.1 LysE family translocator [Desulfovibrio aminophilus]